MQTSGYVVRTAHPFFVVRFGKESFHDHNNALNWPIYSDVSYFAKEKTGVFDDMNKLHTRSNQLSPFIFNVM